MTKRRRITDPGWKRAASTLGLASVLAATASAQVATPSPPTATDAYRLGETIVVLGQRPRIADEVATIDTITARTSRVVAPVRSSRPSRCCPASMCDMAPTACRGSTSAALRTRNIVLLQDGVPLNSGYDGQFDPAVDPGRQHRRDQGDAGWQFGAVRAGRQCWRNRDHHPVGRRVAACRRRGRVRILRGVRAARLAERPRRRRRPVAVGVGSSTATISSCPTISCRRRCSRATSASTATASRTHCRATSSSARAACRSGLSLSYRDGEYGKPPTTINSTESIFASRPRYERVDFDSFSAQLAGRLRLGRVLSLRPTLYFNRDNELTDGYDDAGYDTQVRSGAFREDATTEVYGRGLLGSVRIGARHPAVRIAQRPAGELGVERIHRDHDHQRWRRWWRWGRWRWGGGGGGTITVVRPFDQDESIDLYSLDVEAEWPVSDALGLVAGVGYSKQSRDAGQRRRWRFVPAGRRLSSRRAHDAAGHRRAEAALSDAARPLRRGSRQSGPRRPRRRRPTTSRWSIASAPAGWVVEGVLFRIDADDFIERVPGGITQNFEEYRFQGVEVSAGYRGLERLGTGRELHVHGLREPVDRRRHDDLAEPAREQVLACESITR